MLLPLHTQPPTERRDYDLIGKKLDKDMAKYPGLTLTLGYTFARPALGEASVTWKIEASGRTGKTNRSRRRYLGRYHDMEHGMTLNELWFDMHTDSYSIWVKRQADKVSPEYLVKESLDNPYSWKHTFKTSDVMDDWDDTGEEYEKDVLNPVQIIHFQTDEGVKYIWYAKQNSYSDTTWEIAFGSIKGQKPNGGYDTEIGKTGSGNAFRIFATVLEITNAFVEYDEDNYEIHVLTLSSKGNNRTSLYKRHLIPRIENFEISYEQQNGDETELHLTRQF